MKKSSIIMLLVCTSTFFSSCSKWELEEACPNNATYTIDGQYFFDCSMKPMSNQRIYLGQARPNYSKYQSILDSTITDSIGRFEFSYRSDDPWKKFIFFINPFGVYIPILSEIPERESFYELDVYRYPSVNFEYSISTENPRSANDTLVLITETWGNSKIPGPFKSGVVLVEKDVYLFEQSMSPNYSGVRWYFTPYPGFSNDTSFGITEFCDHTVKVTIDID